MSNDVMKLAREHLEQARVARHDVPVVLGDGEHFHADTVAMAMESFAAAIRAEGVAGRAALEWLSNFIDPMPQSGTQVDYVAKVLIPGYVIRDAKAAVATAHQPSVPWDLKRPKQQPKNVSFMDKLMGLLGC